MKTEVRKEMKITIEIGPNRVTKTLSKLRNALKEGKNGFKNGWKQFDGRPASSVKKAA